MTKEYKLYKPETFYYKGFKINVFNEDDYVGFLVIGAYKNLDDMFIGTNKHKNLAIEKVMCQIDEYLEV